MRGHRSFKQVVRCMTFTDNNGLVDALATKKTKPSCITSITVVATPGEPSENANDYSHDVHNDNKRSTESTLRYTGNSTVRDMVETRAESFISNGEGYYTFDNVLNVAIVSRYLK